MLGGIIVIDKRQRAKKQKLLGATILPESILSRKAPRKIPDLLSLETFPGSGRGLLHTMAVE